MVLTPYWSGGNSAIITLSAHALCTRCRHELSHYFTWTAILLKGQALYALSKAAQQGVCRLAVQRGVGQSCHPAGQYGVGQSCDPAVQYGVGQSRYPAVQHAVGRSCCPAVQHAVGQGYHSAAQHALVRSYNSAGQHTAGQRPLPAAQLPNLFRTTSTWLRHQCQYAEKPTNTFGQLHDTRSNRFVRCDANRLPTQHFSTRVSSTLTAPGLHPSTSVPIYNQCGDQQQLQCASTDFNTQQPQHAGQGVIQHLPSAVNASSTLHPTSPTIPVLNPSHSSHSHSQAHLQSPTPRVPRPNRPHSSHPRSQARPQPGSHSTPHSPPYQRPHRAASQHLSLSRQTSAKITACTSLPALLSVIQQQMTVMSGFNVFHALFHASQMYFNQVLTGRPGTAPHHTSLQSNTTGHNPAICESARITKSMSNDVMLGQHGSSMEINDQHDGPQLHQENGSQALSQQGEQRKRSCQERDQTVSQHHIRQEPTLHDSRRYAQQIAALLHRPLVDAVNKFKIDKSTPLSALFQSMKYLRRMEVELWPDLLHAMHAAVLQADVVDVQGLHPKHISSMAAALAHFYHLPPSTSGSSSSTVYRQHLPKANTTADVLATESAAGSQHTHAVATAIDPQNAYVSATTTETQNKFAAGMLSPPSRSAATAAIEVTPALTTSEDGPSASEQGPPFRSEEEMALSVQQHRQMLQDLLQAVASMLLNPHMPCSFPAVLARENQERESKAATVLSMSPPRKDQASEEKQALNTSWNASDLWPVAWALAITDYPDREVLTQLAEVARPRLRRFDSKELTSLAWAYIRAGHPLTTSILQDVAAHILLRVPQTGEGTAATMLWCLSHLRSKTVRRLSQSKLDALSFGNPAFLVMESKKDVDAGLVDIVDDVDGGDDMTEMPSSLVHGGGSKPLHASTSWGFQSKDATPPVGSASVSDNKVSGSAPEDSPRPTATQLMRSVLSLLRPSSVATTDAATLSRLTPTADSAHDSMTDVQSNPTTHSQATYARQLLTPWEGSLSSYDVPESHLTADLEYGSRPTHIAEEILVPNDPNSTVSRCVHALSTRVATSATTIPNLQWVATTLYSIARLGYYDRQIVEQLCRRFEKGLHMEATNSQRGRSICNMLWALTTLRHYDGPLMQTLLEATCEQAGRLEDVSWGQVLFASAMLRQPHQKLTALAVQHIKTKVNRGCLASIAQLSWGLGILEYTEDVSVFHTLFSCLKNAPISQFSEATRSKLWQTNLTLMDLLPPEEHDLLEKYAGREMAEACKQCWLQNVKAQWMSELQARAVKVLRTVGANPIPEQVTPDGMFSVDIIAHWKGKVIPVEINGPLHYLRNEPSMLTGVTQWRDRRLQHRFGCRVLHLSCRDLFASTQRGGAHQQFHIMNLLQQHAT